MWGRGKSFRVQVLVLELTDRSALSAAAQLFCYACFSPIILLRVFQPNYFTLSVSAQLLCSECFNQIILLRVFQSNYFILSV